MNRMQSPESDTDDVSQSSAMETSFRLPRTREVNAQVPQFKDLSKDRRRLQHHLEVLYERSGTQPICLVEHKDCFTNGAMRDTLQRLLGGVRNFRKYVMVYSIDPSIYQYPLPMDDKIYILGGSVSETYDRFGHDFTRRFSLPLTEAVAASSRMRVLAVCFGYQSMAEAYGKFVGVPIRTVKEVSQFGVYPLQFHQHSALEPLVSELPRYAVFSRSGYPQTSDARPVSSIPGIRTFASLQGEFCYGSSSSHYLPPGVSYLKDPVSGHDKMIGVQFHPEIQNTKKHVQPILEFMDTIRSELMVSPEIGLEWSIGRVRKSIAQVFMTSVLGHFAKAIADQV